MARNWNEDWDLYRQTTPGKWCWGPSEDNKDMVLMNADLKSPILSGVKPVGATPADLRFIEESHDALPYWLVQYDILYSKVQRPSIWFVLKVIWNFIKKAFTGTEGPGPVNPTHEANQM